MGEIIERKYDDQVYTYYSIMIMAVFDKFNGKINSSFSSLECSMWFSKSSYGIYFYGNRCIIPLVQTVDEVLEGKVSPYSPTAKMELVYRILVAMACLENDSDRYPIKDHDKYVDNSVAKYVHDFIYAHVKDIHTITGIPTKDILYIIYIKYYKYDPKYALPFMHIGKEDIMLYMMRWILEYDETLIPENYRRLEDLGPTSSNKTISDFYKAFVNAIQDDAVAVRFIDSSNENSKPFDIFWIDNGTRRSATIDSYIRYMSAIAEFKDDNGFNAVDLNLEYTDKVTDSYGNKIIDFYL